MSSAYLGTSVQLVLEGLVAIWSELALLLPLRVSNASSVEEVYKARYGFKWPAVQ